MSALNSKQWDGPLLIGLAKNVFQVHGGDRSDGSKASGMRYDLKQVQELCSEFGLQSKLLSDAGAEWVEVDLGEQAVLCFVNAAEDKDCLIGFKGTGWHFHDDFVFVDKDRGQVIRLNYLDVLRRLANGQVVVLEHWRSRLLQERRLMHSDAAEVLDYVTMVQSLEPGAEIRIWRART